MKCNKSNIFLIFTVLLVLSNSIVYNRNYFQNGPLAYTCPGSNIPTNKWSDNTGSGYCQGLNTIANWKGYNTGTNNQVQIPVLDNGKIIDAGGTAYTPNTYRQIIIPLSTTKTFGPATYQNLQLRQSLQYDIQASGIYRLTFQQKFTTLTVDHSYIKIKLESTDGLESRTIVFNGGASTRTNASIPASRSGAINTITITITNRIVAPIFSIGSTSPLQTSAPTDRWRTGVKNFNMHLTGCADTTNYSYQNLLDGSQACINKNIKTLNQKCSKFKQDTSRSDYFDCAQCTNPYLLIDLDSNDTACNLIKYPGALYNKQTLIKDINDATLITPRSCNLASGNYVQGSGNLRIQIVSAGVILRYEETGIVCLDKAKQVNLPGTKLWTYSSSTQIYTPYSCQSGYRFQNVQVSALQILQYCLSDATQVIPGCNLYIISGGVYYCKTGSCQNGYDEIKIGLNPNQLACNDKINQFDTLFFGACQYYQRPTLVSTQLLCQVCTLPNLAKPYCNVLKNLLCAPGTIESYIVGDDSVKCAKYGLTQFCSKYQSFNSLTQTLGSCKICYTDYNLVTDSTGTKICIQTIIPGCSVYTSDGLSCTSCISGTYNPVLKTCSSSAFIFVKYCQTAIILANNQIRCQICKPEYRRIFWENKYICVLGVDYCAFYDDQGCTECVPDYYLDTNSESCLLINNVDKCLQFDYQLRECTKCQEGYQLDLVGKCIRILICKEKQFKNSKGLCITGNISHCIQYNSLEGFCEVCQLNWQVNSSGNCEQVPLLRRVILCQPDNDTVKWQQIQGQCVALSPGCGQLNNDRTCRYCVNTTFYLDQGQCKRYNR